MSRSLLFVALLAAGCGGNSFTNLFPDNREVDVAAVLARIGDPAATSRPSNALGRPIVVLSRHGEPQGLVAWDVEANAKLWSVDRVVDSQPWIAGGAVLFKSGDELVSLALANGEELGTLDLDGLVLYGVAAADGLVAVTAGSGGGSVAASFRSGRIWILDEALSRRVSATDVDKLVGAPAVAGGMVFVPWDRQNVTVLDGATGDELCRLVIGDEMVTWLFAAPEGVFYGGKGVFRLTERSASGRKATSTFRAMEWTDPGFPSDPELWPDAFAGVADGRPHARARARLAWYPGLSTGDDEVAFADDRLYFVYYRYLVAMRPGDRALMWVRGLDGPVAEAAAVPGGVFVVQESGALRFLRAADGADGWTGESGVPVARAGIGVSGWVPAGDGSRGEDLRSQALAALLDPDAAAVPVRSLVLALFGRMTDPGVSRDLLQVLRTPQMPVELRNEAAHALQLRPDGDDFLKQALEDHFDYLHDVPTPPVGVIASALRNMNATAAASDLVAHLFDPETPQEAMEVLVRSIVALGDGAVVAPLERFLRMYGADTEFTVFPNVLEAAAFGIAVHGGDDGLEFLEELADEWFTPGGLAELVRNIVAGRRAAGPSLSTLPLRVSNEEFAAVLAADRAAYASCLADARRRRPPLVHVDASFTVTGDGLIVDVSTIPADAGLGLCLKPLVEQLALPRFQLQQDRFVVPMDLTLE
ncbi:MAG: PQQ-binding-like beta-propeller repeat protein [Deltaproteobacteria bacterium]|nr:PQQ-binding-like beta-propeller repeat protein [Deltaproteobacteria bacterium]